MSRIKILIIFVITVITLFLISGCTTTGNLIDNEQYNLTGNILDESLISGDSEDEVIEDEVSSHDVIHEEFSQVALQSPELWPIIKYIEVSDSQIYLRAYHLGIACADFSEYVDMMYDCDRGGTVFVIWVNIPVRNFAFIEVSIGQEGEDSIYLYANQQLHLIDELSPEMPFVVRTFIGCGIPTRGISFLDENDEQRYFLLSTCGLDGSIVLMPYPLDERLLF